MSYLELLQQQIQQDRESARRAASVIGSGFESYFQEQERQRQLREQERERAQKNVAILQQRAESLLDAGQAAEAAKLMPEFQKTVKMGYDLNIPSLNLVGAPAYAEVPINVEAQRPSEKFSGPMPAATVRREVGTTFETPATRAAIRGGFMLKRPEPIKVGSALYDIETGKFSVPPTVDTPEEKMKRLQITIDNKNKIAQLQSADDRTVAAIRAAARGRGGAGRAPRFTWVTGPDGKKYRVMDREGLVSESFVTVPERDESGNITNIFMMKPSVAPAGKVVQQKPQAQKGLSVDDQEKIKVQAARETLRQAGGADVSAIERIGPLEAIINQRNLNANYQKNIITKQQEAMRLKNPLSQAGKSNKPTSMIRELLSDTQNRQPSK